MIENVLSAGAYCRVGVSSAVAVVSANPDAAIAAIAVLRIGCPLAIFIVRINRLFL
jgi:hypothetical protein